MSIKLKPGVDDKAFQINVINSPRLEGRPTWEYQGVGESETITDPHWTDVVIQSQGDSDIAALRSRMDAGNISKYVLQGDILYYLAEKDEEVSLKMVIHEKLRSGVLDQCHRKLGHMGIEKTYGLIMRNYYWPKLFNDVVDHVKKCVTCQVQSRGSKAAPVLETDIPYCTFQKISLDISGPYGLTDRGNCYILSFVDWLTGWPEAFAIPDKRARIVSDIKLSEIFPRYGAPKQLVTDNGSENVNEVMRETLGELNIQHIPPPIQSPE